MVNPRPTTKTSLDPRTVEISKMGSIQLLLEDPSYSAASDQKLSKDMGCIHLLLEDPIYSATWDPKLSKDPIFDAIYKIQDRRQW